MSGPIIYPPQPITFEQYIAEEQVKRRYDIVNGVRVFSVPPSLRHQRILGHLLSPFGDYADAHGYTTLFSLFDVLISWEPFCTRQPDVMLVSQPRLRAHEDGEPLSIAPDLVVEILSSADRELALQTKLRDYSAIEVMRATAEGFKAVQTHGAGEDAHSCTCQNLAVSVDKILAA